MKTTLAVVASLVALVHCFPSPQEYDASLVQDVFGTSGGYNPPGDYNPVNQDQVERVTEVTKVAEDAKCSDFENKGFECVPYYQCDADGTIITNGAGLIDIRNGFGNLDAQDATCQGFLDVCCKNPDFVEPPTPPPPTIKYTSRCGQRNTEGLGARITGFRDLESQVGEWPHMCALLREEVQEAGGDGYSGGDPATINHFVCGASLISDGTVLTAGHCVDKYVGDGGALTATLKVRCGEWDTQTENEPYPHQDRYVDRLFVHPEYFGGALFNDFAVLFTTEDFIMDYNVDSICLPEPQEDFEFEDFVGNTCFATGWGKDKFGKDGNYQVILKEIDLPVVNHATCQTELRKTRLGKRFRLHNSFLCAGGEPGKDTCKGDGGSPLVCPRGDGRYVQAGIVAWGVGCGETGTPGVYADVSKATCWIDYVMAGNVPVRAQEGSTVNTFWGYSQDVCGTWLDYKLDGPLPDVVKSLYQKWNVNWLITKSEPQVSSGDGSYNEPLTDGDADTYNEDTRDVEPYNDANQNAEPYSDGTKAVEPYSDDTKDAEPYSGGIKDAEPYSDGTKDAEPYSDGTKDAEPYSDGTKDAEPYSDGTKDAEPYSDGTKEAEPYSDGTKDAEPYSDDTKDAQPYTDETKEPDSYSEDQVVDVAKTADPYRR